MTPPERGPRPSFTTFESVSPMATLGPNSPPMSPPFNRRRKSCARKVERYCCTAITYFPLLFVHGLTAWAIWVEISVSFLGRYDWVAYVKAGLALLLYALLNVSYSIAVFTDPGSPLTYRPSVTAAGKGSGYSSLPTYENQDSGLPHGMSMVTAKSTGQPRYCKKCQTVKPDRSHHCSNCGKCVLKMDHHCPWLATCVGLRNYKAFLLFLIYTSLFCWVCFAVSASWVWTEIMDETQMQEGMRVVNTILLAVLSGIIGLVLSGFTGWHMYLAVSGQTTIESLEKTRYLSPLRKSMEQQIQAGRTFVGQNGGAEQEQGIGEQLKEIHANILPGVTRPEEGEERSSSSSTPIPPPAWQPSGSPAHDSLRRSYASIEEQRERERYEGYLDEQDSEKLPNAFDLGWKRNLEHVLGDKPLLWFLPVCNTSGDGWQWEVSPKWVEAQDEVARQRSLRQQNGAAAWNISPPVQSNLRWTPGQGFVDKQRYPLGANNAAYGRRSPNKADQILGRQPGMYSDQPVQMQNMDRRRVQHDEEEGDAYDTSSDDEQPLSKVREQVRSGTANWNDVPEEFLAPSGSARSRSRSRGRRKGD